MHFRKSKQHFRAFEIPEVYFFVSGFNQSLLFGDGFVGIGIDMYLGSDYPAYAEIAYNYMTYNMNPEGISNRHSERTFVSVSFPLIANTERLLEGMLYRGKMLYLTSVFSSSIRAISNNGLFEKTMGMGTQIRK
jgi:hypothetical protein